MSFKKKLLMEQRKH